MEFTELGLVLVVYIRLPFTSSRDVFCLFAASGSYGLYMSSVFQMH